MNALVLESLKWNQSLYNADNIIEASNPINKMNDNLIFRF